MDSGITDRPDPTQVLLDAFGRRARQAPMRNIFVSLWSAHPAVGFGDRNALPTLRTAAQGREASAGTDRRSRLPAALEALLRTPALTSKVLAGRRQTATALLRALQAKGDAGGGGKGAFQAFAVRWRPLLPLKFCQARHFA